MPPATRRGYNKIGLATTYREVTPMALYEYKCSDCEEQFDVMRSMAAADEPAQCPECGGTESRRLISNFTSITPGASTLSSNPVMDARIASGGGGGCCGGGCCG